MKYISMLMPLHVDIFLQVYHQSKFNTSFFEKVLKKLSQDNWVSSTFICSEIDKYLL